MFVCKVSSISAKRCEGSEDIVFGALPIVYKIDKDTNSPAYQRFKKGDKRYVYKDGNSIYFDEDFIVLEINEENVINIINSNVYRM